MLLYLFYLFFYFTIDIIHAYSYYTLIVYIGGYENDSPYILYPPVPLFLL